MTTALLQCLGQDINLTTGQRGRIWQIIRDLPVETTSGNPAERNHGRMSLDGSILNFQGRFDLDIISVSAFRQMLASEFGVAVETIGTDRSDIEIGGYTSPFWTFSRSGTNYFRLAVMGGLSATQQESDAALRAYLAANSAEWET